MYEALNSIIREICLRFRAAFYSSSDTDGGTNSINVSAVNSGHICTDNTTSTPLLADAVFTGSWQDTLNYNFVIIGVKADQASAIDGLEVQWSSDGITIDDEDVFTISADAGKVFTFSPARRYVRLVYTNGGSDQTKFSLQTIFKVYGSKSSSHRIQDSIVAEDDAELIKAVLSGENPAGDFVNFGATTAGNFKMSVEEFENNVSEDSNTSLRIAPILEDEFGNLGRMLGDNYFAGVPVIINSDHHEIHCGDSYEMTYIEDMPNGGTTNVLIISPDEGTDADRKRYHTKFIIDTESEALIQIYEGTTVSANGTALSVINRNRDKGFSDFLAMYHTPTVTATGTLLYQKRVGSGRGVGGTATRADEFILDGNTNYLVRVTNGVTTNNYCNMQVDYYVHPGI